MTLGSSQRPPLRAGPTVCAAHRRARLGHRDKTSAAYLRDMSLTTATCGMTSRALACTKVLPGGMARRGGGRQGGGRAQPRRHPREVARGHGSGGLKGRVVAGGPCRARRCSRGLAGSALRSGGPACMRRRCRSARSLRRPGARPRRVLHQTPSLRTSAPWRFPPVAFAVGWVGQPDWVGRSESWSIGRSGGRARQSGRAGG